MARRNRFLGALARPRRGLPGLDAAALPPGARELVERRGARGGAHDGRGRTPGRRPPARFRRGRRDLRGEAEPLHDAARAGALPAGRARGLREALREPARALPQVLCLQAGLPRRRPGIRARRDRLQQHLPQVPEADRAAEGGPAGDESHDPRHRRRRLHRLQLRPRLARRRRRAGGEPRQAHLRGQSRQPGAASRATRATSSCRATSRTSAAVEALLARHRPRAIVHFAAESHVDRSIHGPGRVRPDQRRGHLQAAGGGARPLAVARRRGARGVPLPARVDRRGLRLALRDRPGVHRDDGLRAQQPLFGLQGGERPPGAGLPPHLRAAGAHHQLLQQLRPVPVSREADPADDRQRAGGQAAAGVRRRPAGARLALRRRPLRGHPRGAREGPPRRDLQHRRQCGEAQPRGRARPLRRAAGGCARARAATARSSPT